MEIRNRTADVVKLRSNVCQDFLRMILKDNWQEPLWNIVQREVETGNYRDKYIKAYNRMLDKGIDAYSVDDMDVSFIFQVVTSTRSSGIPMP